MKKNDLILTKTHDYCENDSPLLTVVLIHGIASDSSTYDGLLNYIHDNNLFNNVRFVTFDLLGSGKSLKDDKLNYDYNDQITALNNAISALDLKTPLVLVGHSLGTFIITRYVDTYKDQVKNLILISPPIYTLNDMNNPAFELGIKAFKDIISARDRNIVKEKSFINSMEKIVLNKDNYKTLQNVKTPTTLIYGTKDQLIASYNIPKLIEENPRFISAISTDDGHGVSKDKYQIICDVIRGTLNAKDI